MCQRGTHDLRATNPRTHKHTHANANTHTWRATRRTHCKRHGLRRSRPSPVIAEIATAVRVHVRRRAVEALRAVVLAAEPREKTLLRLVLLPSVELVVRLGQPLVMDASVDRGSVKFSIVDLGGRQLASPSR